jgi:hypothetical protein
MHSQVLNSSKIVSPQQNLGFNSEYLRTRTNLPEVDVPKGTLVRVDPDCQVNGSGVNNSLTVISLDHLDGQESAFDNVKLTVIYKVG